jgi:hypothetical protein
MLRLFLRLLPLVFLASCANVASDFKFDPNKTNGLVVGSISFESSLGRYFLIAQSTTTAQTVQFAFGCTLFPCIVESSDDPKFSKGETPKQRGGGFAIEVPEGTYRIVSWRVARGYIVSRSANPINIEFTVERGKASYIGNLHFDEDWEDVSLRDKSSRDLPLLREQYPILRSTELAFTMAPERTVGHLGGDYRTGMEGNPVPIYVPIIKR